MSKLCIIIGPIFIILFRQTIQFILGMIITYLNHIDLTQSRKNSKYLSIKGLINAIGSLAFNCSLILLPYSYVKILFFVKNSSH